MKNKKEKLNNAFNDETITLLMFGCENEKLLKILYGKEIKKWKIKK